MDITRIPLLFPFLHLHLAVVLDAYSRMPLAAGVFLFEPSARDMLSLVIKAIGQYGKPRHFVTDQGAPFKAGLFRGALEALGIRQRFGALYQHGSMALIERFWKSIKTDLRLAPPPGFDPTLERSRLQATARSDLGPLRSLSAPLGPRGPRAGRVVLRSARSASAPEHSAAGAS
jgi:transposase InsO family protein